MQKRVAPSAERNKESILAQLRGLLTQGTHVLEIGSGTGQHACYFSQQLPDITWQPTELGGGLGQIRLWMSEQASRNLLPPVELDVCQTDWPFANIDFVYTCNTLHIISEGAVECLFSGVGNLLNEGGRLCAYGPFSFDGKHTSRSNEAFDAALRAENVCQGVRDMTRLDSLASTYGFASAEIIDMPSNNFLAVWHYNGAGAVLKPKSA